MDRIWAPWRVKYFKIKKPKKCIFCDKNRFVIHRSVYSVSLLNIFPYNTGHVMIAPKRHVKSLSQLKDKELLDMIKHLNAVVDLLQKDLKPDGFNIGVNLGKISGAGIEGHVHIHIVPRWQGDTNFMPVISSTKVIPESLIELQKRLKRKISRYA